MKTFFNKKWKLWLLLVLVMTFAFYFAYESVTGDFRKQTISFEKAHDSRYEIPALTENHQEKVMQILNQKFHWLNQGRQTFAFVSDDGYYVLKIFKFKRLKPSSIQEWLADLPIDYFKNLEKKRLRRIEKLFNGYHIAYTKDPENTGLVYIHLNKTENLFPNVIVNDWFGIPHSVDLNDAIFAIQRKGRSTKEVLSKLLDKEDFDTAKLRIRQLIKMYISEYRKGIVDLDRNIVYNTGFVDSVPVRIDVGQLSFDPSFKQPEIYQQDLEKVFCKRLYRWLKRHYPKFDLEACLR